MDILEWPVSLPFSFQLFSKSIYPSILPSISQFNPWFHHFIVPYISIVLCMKKKTQFLLIFTPVPSSSLPLSLPLTYASFPVRLPCTPSSLLTSRPSFPPPQGVVPAAEPAHGRSAGLHLRRTAGPQPRRRLDGPGHAVRVLQPAARRHQVLHQRHTQQGLHQHHRANPPHQMPAGGWREEFKAGGAHTMAIWMQFQFNNPLYENSVTLYRSSKKYWSI